MNKGELIKAVAAEAGETQKVVDVVIGAIAKTIAEECVGNGQKILIPGLGTFSRKVNAARVGKNPKTGEPVNIKETWVLKFAPAFSTRHVIE